MARSYNANTDRDSGSRDTVYRKKPTASAPAASKGPANAGPVKTAGAPTPTKRPSPNTASRSPAPAANPSVDKQYSSYSSSGATQSGKTSGGTPSRSRSPAPAAAPKAGPSVASYGAGMSTRKSVSNDQARMNMSNAGSRAPKKKFSLLKAMQQDTRKYMK